MTSLQLRVCVRDALDFKRQAMYVVARVGPVHSGSTKPLEVAVEERQIRPVGPGLNHANSQKKMTVYTIQCRKKMPAI